MIKLSELSFLKIGVIKMEIYDNYNNKIILNSTPIASGNEGSVYAITNDNTCCVKIYNDTTRASSSFVLLQEKLEYMCSLQLPDNILNSLSFPKKVIFNSDKNFIGYMMPFLVNATQLKYLFNGHEQKYFPHFNQQYRFAVAKNLALLVKNLHSHDIIIGDFRDSNILVGGDSKVYIIDTDSFQINDKLKNKIYHCKLGVEDYLAPEWQGKISANQDLNKYYNDLFALAVLIFQLLMNNCHPYQCIGQLASYANSRGEKIKLGYFPYTNSISGIQIPKYAPQYNQFASKRLRGLFEQCFVTAHNNPQLRPNVQEWLSALEQEFSNLQCCTKNTNHYFINSLISCPYCVANQPQQQPQQPQQFNAQRTNAQATPPRQSTTATSPPQRPTIQFQTKYTLITNFIQARKDFFMKMSYIIIVSTIIISLIVFITSHFHSNDAQDVFSSNIYSISKDIENNPKSIQLYINRAIALKDIELYENALNDLSLVKNIEENNHNIAIQKCEIYTILEKYDYAYKQCDIAISFGKPDATTLLSYGRNLFVKNNYKSAIVYFQKSIVLDKSIVATFLLGLSKEAVGENADAILMYEEAFELKKSQEDDSLEIKKLKRFGKNLPTIDDALDKLKTKISTNAHER